MSVQIQVDSTEVLDALNKALSLRGFKRGLAAAGALILSRTATYPRQRSGSTYRRTGRLGRGWAMEGRNGGLQVVIGNAVEYAPRVQGIGSDQDEFFRERGWLSPDTVAEQNERGIAALIDAYSRTDL